MPETAPAEPVGLVEVVTSAIPAFLNAMGCPTSDSLVAAVGTAVDPVRLAAGDVLFDANDEPDAAYFVVTGRLVVVIDDDNETTLRHLGRGELVGEVGLIEGTRRSAGIRADRESILARLPRVAFDSLAREYPEFLMGITRTVVGRLADPSPPVNEVGNVAVVIASADIDETIFAAGLEQTIAEHGSVMHASQSSVAAAIGESDGIRVEQYLDGVESENRFVLFEAGREVSEWSKTALRRADRVLIVVTAGADDRELALARSFAETARVGNQPEVWLAIVRDAAGSVPQGSAALADRVGVDRVLHLRSDVDGDLARTARLATGTGTGLVFGGGAARGFAHIGAYRALVELGIPIDAVAGASIGGIIGAVVATMPDPDELTRMAVSGFSKVLDYTLPLVSMVKGQRISAGIDGVFAGVDFEDLPLPFLCVSTNLTTSEQVIHDRGSVTVATRAGLAIPGVIPPVPHDGDLLVDGGVLDNLPIEPLRSTGLVDTVIAVDVAPPVGPRAREDFGLSVSGWGALRSKLARGKRRYPGVSALLLRSMIVGSMKQRNDQVAAGMADLLLTPDLRGISLLAFDKVEAVASAGYDAMYPVIEEWLAVGDGA